MIDLAQIIGIITSLIDLLTPNFVYSNGGNTTLNERSYEVCTAKEIGMREKGLFPGGNHRTHTLTKRRKQ